MSLLCEPELTTIDQNNDVLCERVMSVLFDRINGKATGAVAETIKPKLIVRGSA